jgi:ABC transporter DrrB family efflux protein
VNTPARYSPLWELFLARLREFYREPHAVFWVYGFPLVVALALGVAFRERPTERIRVDVRAGTGAEEAAAALRTDARIEATVLPASDADLRYARAKTDLVVVPTASGYEYHYDPNRPESVLARAAADAAVLRADASRGLPAASDVSVTEVGRRYIDFLLPGLVGMNLMGGGLFGVGFVVSELRVRKLLKRYAATPMRRSDFLISVALSRLVFSVSEVLILLAFGWLVFGVAVRGNVLVLLGVVVLGAASFMGLGLLVASRAKTTETVSGLVNLTMLPQFVLSGVFFSADRFPEWLQPFVQALPLTVTINALRGVMLDGLSPLGVWRDLLILTAWGTLSFALSLFWFRWK